MTFGRKRAAVLAVAAAAAIAALAVASTASSKTGAGGVIGESNPVASNPNQQAITYGERQAAKHYGWSVKSLDANLSPDKQVSDIDALVSLGVKGIITWTLDPGAADAAYKRAVDKGIPVVDFGNLGPVTTTEINDARGFGCGAGHNAAAYIAKRAPKGQVIAIGGPPVPAITNYTNCFITEAGKLGLKIVGKQYNVKDTAATAQPMVQDLLTKHPDVAAIWCYNDPSCLGAGAVVRSSGKQVWVEGKSKGIIVMGANGSKDAVAAIKQGVMTATWDPQPPEMGKLAVEVLAIKLIQKKTPPRHIVVPLVLWDATNVSKYLEPMKRKVVVGPIPTAWIVKG
jgi:ribose transport system substrate-binding protein